MKKIPNEQLGIPEVKKHPFKIMTLHDALKEELPPIKKLIGGLIYPKQQTILYGGSNLGKSNLAMMMAKAICEGKSLDLGNAVVLKNECDAMNVVYFDFELGQDELQLRYKNYIPKNLYWLTVERGETVEAVPIKVFNQLKSAAEEVDAKCLIIDNMSAVSSDIEKAENAKIFMKELWRLAKDEGYSIIVLAHTPKVSDFEPISINHLKGSSVLGQLTDALVAIGKVKSDDEGEIYIKQVKSRNGKKIYGASHVIHARIIEFNYELSIQAIGYDSEENLLNNVPANADKAPYRNFYTICSLYYGDHRKAHNKLSEVSIVAAASTIYDNAKKFEKDNGKIYNEWKGWSKDRQKEYLDSDSNYPNIEFPYADGHNSVPTIDDTSKSLLPF